MANNMNNTNSNPVTISISNVEKLIINYAAETQQLEEINNKLEALKAKINHVDERLDDVQEEVHEVNLRSKREIALSIDIVTFLTYNWTNGFHYGAKCLKQYGVNSAAIEAGSQRMLNYLWSMLVNYADELAEHQRSINPEMLAGVSVMEFMKTFYTYCGRNIDCNNGDGLGRNCAFQRYCVQHGINNSFTVEQAKGFGEVAKTVQAYYNL